MLHIRERGRWGLKRLLRFALIIDVFYFLVLPNTSLSSSTIFASFISLSVFNSLLLLIKNSKTNLLKQFVVTVLINVPIWIGLNYFATHTPPTNLGVKIMFVALLFSTFTSALTLLFCAINKVIEHKKYQLVFNISLFLFLGGLSYFLYQSNLTAKKELETSNSRLRLLEKKLGGQENLKCIESETIDKIRKSVVRVIGGEGEGSGFAIEKDKILTNFHVIEFEPSPRVVYSDNSFENAEILYADKVADLAVLKIGKNLTSLAWGNSDYVNSTDEILAIGYPFGGDLSGEATVKKGFLSAKRSAKSQGLEMLQTDSTINPGMSGGPMVTVCGDFVGINTLGTSGMGMAISSNSFKEKYVDMKSNKEPLKDIKKIEFEPNKSPLDAVTAFYNYIKVRKMDKAYALLTDNFLKGGTFEQWLKGYQINLDTSVIMIDNHPTKKNVVQIKLTTKDFEDDVVVYKYFEGWWEVKEIDGELKLWWPDIKEVKDPNYFWPYADFKE